MRVQYVVRDLLMCSPEQSVYFLEIEQAITIHPKGGVPCTLAECA